MKKIAILLIVVFSSIISNSSAQVAVGLQISVAPPDLPVYVQPPCPTEGYLWSPGYWAYGPDGYYWVPGVWVAPPDVELLWTPGYWGFDEGFYVWHGGYWGPEVGFYGGVCYGFGYTGVGFYGGRWEGREFRYNTAVWQVHSGFHNTYSDRAEGNVGARGKSFNGPGGITSRPTAAEQSAMNSRHVQPTSEQMSHEHNASTDRNQLASVNKGRPSTTAMNSVKGTGFNSAGHSASGTHATHSTHPSTPHDNVSTQHSSSAHTNTAPAQHHTNTTPTQHQTNKVPVQHHTANNAAKPHAQPSQQQQRAPENRVRTQPAHNNTQHTPPPAENHTEHTPPPAQNMQHSPPPQQMHTPPPAPHNMGGGEPHHGGR
ncbi:MAG TPA: hypothetical protein VK806_00410 [Bacteroidia bacterium]|nr:hypothetical protein [Bacteroidia bacterium]